MSIKHVSEMSYAELLEFKKQAEARLSVQRSEELKAVAEQVKAQIQTSGFDLSEVLPLLGVKAGKMTAAGSERKPAIYFHPDDSSKGWSGFGRAPDWVKAYLGVDKVRKADPEQAAKLKQLER